jgi:hypothetical protein
MHFIPASFPLAGYFFRNPILTRRSFAPDGRKTIRKFASSRPQRSAYARG